MAISNFCTSFAGLPVAEWSAGQSVDPSRQAVRITLPYEGESWPALFSDYLATPRAGETRALIVGSWGNPYETDADDVVQALLAARSRLPQLKALFVGEITFEEAEISWIQQTNLGPLLAAWPLEQFQARGGQGLALGPLRNPQLHTLVVETGGLPASVLADLARSELPALRHLELWLGDSEYGWDGDAADVKPLLGRFPALRYLGLRNSEVADAVAQLVAADPVLERLETLDLSMGTLGDIGAQALLESAAVGRLKRLDLSHHYICEELQARLKALPCEVDLSDFQEEEEEGYRYVAVGE